MSLVPPDAWITKNYINIISIPAQRSEGGALLLRFIFHDALGLCSEVQLVQIRLSQ